MGIAFIATLIAAIPFGLVNLSVMSLALKKGKNNARKTAFGAGIIEILFAIIATTSLSFTNLSTLNSNTASYSIAVILLITSISFFFKKSNVNKNKTIEGKYFLKGIFFNFISLQVLAFWFAAIAFLISKNIEFKNMIKVTIFLITIFLTKILVLEAYIQLGNKVIKTQGIVEKNINKIIGSVLIATAFFQIIKINTIL